jgi:hypothetical protein
LEKSAMTFIGNLMHKNPNCMYCGNVTGVQSRGKTTTGKRRFYCKTCDKMFNDSGVPKILLLDIETSHIIFKAWDTGDQYLRPNQIVRDWFIICWSAKWLFGENVISDVLTSKEAIKGDDKRLLKGIHQLLSDCNVVITQNGDYFDLRKLNWRFIKHGFPPNNHYISIDTLKKSRQVADPTSHGLGYVMTELGLDGKSEVDDKDWLRAEDGDKASLEKLSKYCSQDVLSQEDWYLVLRPWMKTHPNLAPYMEMYQTTNDEKICPRCLQPNNDAKFSKLWLSNAGKWYKRTNCAHCGCVIRISLAKFKEE